MNACITLYAIIMVGEPLQRGKETGDKGRKAKLKKEDCCLPKALALPNTVVALSGVSDCK